MSLSIAFLLLAADLLSLGGAEATGAGAGGAGGGGGGILSYVCNLKMQEKISDWPHKNNQKAKIIKS